MDMTDPAFETGLAALDRACEILGNQDALALKLNIRSPSISGWRRRKNVPIERCIDIERATEGQVSRYELRPDVFGDAATPQLQQVG
jgi:DNA-binding transcriptional regulator YdaS (Cro superfamily)